VLSIHAGEESQLSRLVKAALAGEEVIIASAEGLQRPGALPAAFSEAVDQQVAQLFNA
jgi:hypothetical protein